MTGYDFAALVVAGLAAIGNLVLFFRQPELVRRQIERMEREDREARRADIRVAVEKQDGGARKLVVRNVGQASARTVNVSVESMADATRGASALYPPEVRDLLPIDEIPPRGGKFTLSWLGSDSDCLPPYQATVTWTDADGEPRKINRTLNV